MCKSKTIEINVGKDLPSKILKTMATVALVFFHTRTAVPLLNLPHLFSVSQKVQESLR
jgi:hypothetical protein